MILPNARRSLVLVLVLCTMGARARAQEFEVTQEEIDRTLALASPAVRAAYKFEPDVAFHARVATLEEIQKVLTAENEPLMLAQLGDEDAAHRQAVQFGLAYSPALLAKYAFAEREILIPAQSYATIAKTMGNPKLHSEAVLHAVLVHELIHAADDRVYEFSTVLRGLTTADAIAAYNAVFEGHAQVVARKLCADLGWTDGFETFYSSIGAIPATGDEGAGMELLRRIASATAATSYYDGERFMAALEKEGGAELVKRAFREPPRDLAEVFEPQWYLHPELRPTLRFDLQRALGELADDYAEYGDDMWKPAQLALTRPQLEAALSSFPEEVRDPLIRSVRQSRVLLMSPEDAPNSKQITVALFELPTPAEATIFLEANERLMHTKDEQMKTGAVRVADASYEPFERGELKGVLVDKTVMVQSSKNSYRGLTAARGCIVVEVGFSNESYEREELLSRIERLIARALQPIEKAPAAKEESK